MHIAIIVYHHPYSYEDMDTAVNILRALREEEHKCTLMLFMDAVTAANKEIKPPKYDRNIAEKLQDLMNKGVNIIVCGSCTQYRGVSKAELLENVSLGGLSTLGEVIKNSDRVINIGW